MTKDGVLWRQYAYDPNGNRTSDRQAGQLAVTSAYDAQDRLISRGTETFTYTDAGELATRTDTSTGDVTSYTHTARGLEAVELPDGTEITYDLDALGRRVAVRRDGVVTRRYLYGLEAIGPVAELNPDNTIRTRFVYATRSHVPDYMVRDGVTYRLVTDEQGSVRRVVNTATGAVEQRLSYDPYGVVLEDTQPGFQPFGYTGGLTDPDTGLVRLGYRDYDPTLARWLSKDPIGFGGGDTNQYAYAADDPINSIDPTGLILDTLVDLFDASTEAAAAATAYWADQSVNSDSSIVRGLATGAGLLSSLWACGNATDTALTLAPMGALGRLAGLAGKGAAQVATRAVPKLAGGAPIRAFRPSQIHGVEEALAYARRNSGRIRRDGVPFENRNGLLPPGAYQEYTVRTPGIAGRGERRLVYDRGADRAFYTWNHYDEFVEVAP